MTKKSWLIGAGLVLILLLAVVGWLFVIKPQSGAALVTVVNNKVTAVVEPFPVIDTRIQLTSTQNKIVDLARTEYSKMPTGYDQNVLKYTQGNREPWCADFVSWIMQQAGLPYINPNSGGWRIPGVYTLRDFYQSKNLYEPVGSYEPRVGDVAIYDSQQTHDPSNNVHVAIVLSVHDGQLVTIGGNEGGRLRVSTRALKLGENGLVGFGKLPADKYNSWLDTEFATPTPDNNQ